MKRKSILFILLFVFFSILNVRARVFETKIERVLTRSEVLLSFNEEEAGSISGIWVSGNVKFTSLDGNVRILTADQFGREKLIYESYPMLAIDGGKDHFHLMGLETGEIKNYIPKMVKVVILNAEVNHLKITVRDIAAIGNGSPITPQAQIKSLPWAHVIDSLPDLDKDEAQRSFIAKLNSSLETSGALWRAGETPISRLSYEEKKVLFGGEVPDLNGAEYYVGGILDIGNARFRSVEQSTSRYVSDFDWRTRHGATVKGSPYFQNENTGWVTPVRIQQVTNLPCNSCWAFAAAGAMETIAKLYKNTLYNFDLSEQELLSCSGAGNCKRGGSAFVALDYISREGIRDEITIPYQGENYPCKKLERARFLFEMKNSGVDLFAPVIGEDFVSIERLKGMLIRSPLAGRVDSWRHAMVLVGYKTVKAGDVVYITLHDSIVVPPKSPIVGQTVWIFKNSWGEEWGDHGFLYAWADIGEFVESSVPTLPFEFKYNPQNNPSAASPELEEALQGSVQAYDKDNDGYFWWGIGPRPQNLPPDAKPEEDSDDNDATIGPMDEYGHPTFLQKAYDLCIKDNIEDKGFEPNISIRDDNFWTAPEVWIRNVADGIQEHQNPIPGKTNYIYVRVWNIGKHSSPESRLKVYWAKAGTNLQWPDAWNGTLKAGGHALGGTVENLGLIPSLISGGSAIVSIPWSVPHPKDFSLDEDKVLGGDNLWHFCLLLCVSDKMDTTRFVTSDVHTLVVQNNNVAQKNLIIDRGDVEASFGGTVSVANFLDHKESYSLDLIEIAKPDEKKPFTHPKSIFDMAKVKLIMGPGILSAWKKGGRRGKNVKATKHPHIQEFVSSYSSLDGLKLNVGEIGLTKLSVKFSKPLSIWAAPEKHFLLLRLKDGKGNVVGGETFGIIRSAKLQYPLTANKKDEVSMSLSPLSVQSELTVSYDLPNGEYELRISGVQNRLNQKIYKLDSTKKDIRINVSHFSCGIYIATIIGKDGNTIKSVKFIKE